MNLQVGSIVDQNVCAIVNAANGFVGVMGAGVAKAIRDNGGWSIQNEAVLSCKKNQHMPGTAYVTSAGVLPAKYVIHAVTMRYPGERTSLDTVKACLKAVFETAASLNCKSICIPGLGTNIGRAPLDQVAEAYASLIPQLEKETGIEATVCDINRQFILLIEQAAANGK